jgi:uncharacterized protein (TIGR02466 family)
MTTKSPANQFPVSELPELLQQAISVHQAGDLDKAEPLYRQFLAQQPEQPTALQLLGLLHSQKNEHEIAIELMQKSLRLFPQQAEVANNLANSLSSCGRLDEAIESYLQATTIKPVYIEAWRNLGLCYTQQENYEQSNNAFLRCLEIQPEDAISWFCMADMFQKQGNIDSAIQYLQKTLELKPDYAEAHHNMGVCLRLKQKPAEAIRYYENACQLGLDRAELYQNLGSAQVDVQHIDAAMQAYRKAIERNPEDIISHSNLNKLLWEQELLDDYLHSYEEALLKIPASEQLAMSYSIALNQQENHEQAEQVLSEALRRSPDSSELKSLLAYTYECQDEWDNALQMHAQAVASADSIANHRISYARALLACQRPKEALAHAEKASIELPFNQRAIAYLGLCWRMLDNEADAFINDYENFVQIFDIPVPAQYSSRDEFNEQLTLVLNSLHLGKRHPPEQTLRGGTQTHGDLFERKESEIQDLVSGLSECVHEYINKLPANDEHPLLMRRSQRFDFSASWSVRLQRSGYHTMHVHPLGWISSAYYVQVPPEVSESDARGGGIKFGEPDINIGWRGVAKRHIQPQAGRLVLFPSYMWHGTIPFESNAPRMTVAFDVEPVHD